MRRMPPAVHSPWSRTVRRIARAAIAVCALVAGQAAAQAPAQTSACRVLDPELQTAYEGGCRDGLADGAGEARGPNAEYRGTFRAGRKHGNGVKTWLDTGDRYEGAFVDDAREGRGRYTWGPRSPWAGETFEGEYRGDRRNGTGTYTWSSGDRYVGPWRDDQQTGPQTALQVQRTRAAKAWLAAIGRPGAAVCGSTKVGIAHAESVQGEVVEVLQDRIRIRITHVAGKRVERQDVSFWDLVLNWRPCR